MTDIQIITDSNCDIPKEMAQELGIEIVPIHVVVDGVEYEESVSFTPVEYYDILAHASSLPQTSQITSYEFQKRFENAYQSGKKAVICITMTSVGSSIYQNAIRARRDFYEECDGSRAFDIYVIDSKNYSISYGYAAIRAAQKQREGASLEEILFAATDWIEHLETYFTVFSLEYISKSGRISHAASIIGDTLGMRPLIQNINGSFEMVRKVRGNHAVVKAVSEMFRSRKMEDTDYVILQGTMPEMAQELAQQAELIAGKPPVGIFYSGPTITTNTGPKNTGIGFMAKK